MSNIFTFALNDGGALPKLGYGTWQVNGADADFGVTQAIHAGYRHIDTARYYHNEADVGRAVAASGIARSELYITSKVWYTDMHGDNAADCLEDSLAALGLEYLDMYLLHWPFGEVAASWAALEDCQQRGLVRHIGVSNFQPHHLEELLKTARVVPAVDQFESNPHFAQPAAVAYCLEHGIVPVAWGPLGKGRDLSDATLQRIAQKYGRSAAQIALRWQLQRGVAVIPKSLNAERIRENARIFDFELADDDMAAIDALNTGVSGRNYPEGYEF